MIDRSHRIFTFLAFLVFTVPFGLRAETFGLILLEPVALHHFANERLPLQRDVSILNQNAGRLTIEKDKILEILLLENPGRARVRVDFNFSPRLTSRSISGTATVIGEISYDRDSGEFHLRNPDVSLDTSNFGPVRDTLAGWAIEVGLKQVFSERPVYKLNMDNAIHSVARMILQRVEIRSGAVHAWVGLGRVDDPPAEGGVATHVREGISVYTWKSDINLLDLFNPRLQPR